MTKLLSLTIVLAILAWMIDLNIAHAQTYVAPDGSQSQVYMTPPEIAAPPSSWVCWGLVGCLIAGAMEAQERQSQGPHICNVWNGRQWVRATCAP